VERARASFEFSALGTYVHVQTAADLVPARRRTEEILTAVDLACSRFRRDSDLSRANASPGEWIAVSGLFLAALQVAVAAAAETQGLVDPCLGRTMIDLGYDTDFARLVPRPTGSYLPAPHPSTGAWANVTWDDDAVRVPEGVALDLGATAKAWASDLVALSLFDEFGEPVLVSLGGDIRIVGGQQKPDAWAVEVTENPGGVGETVTPASIWLSDGGLATSSTRVRRWRSGGAEHHHLVDPRTGCPVEPFWRTVTATGPTCVAANVSATAALVLGADAVDWLSARNVSARLIGQDRRVQLVGDWPEQPVTTGAGQRCSRV
jgi:thiamine biosynthesis lipoprotein